MGEPSDVAVAVADLRVRRGGREVLHGLDFEIHAGDVVGLLGPSGGGKTTLMRAIVGVQRHVTGRCEVLGHGAGDANLRSRVGYVTQAPSVYADLTVRENLRYFAAVSRAGVGAVDRVVEQVDLGAVADQLVHSLSGGQQRRVSLASALLGTPELLVLDEPTVGLDPLLRRDLWELFHDFTSRGTTLLVSSHVMDEARHCDRLLLLRDGRLVADETEQALLERTRTSDVADAFVALVEEGPP